MNEPKRRGRPPKLATFTNAVAEGVKKLDPTEPVRFHRDPFDVRLAQNYANRVWKGQSSSESRAWRLARVEAALKAQGLSMEGVEL